MHAVRLHTFGPAENLTYETTDDPVPGPGQVRIAVAAAGVHLLDTALREGMTGPFPAPAELPTVPGREVAGTVDMLGGSTDPGLLGRRVVAHLGTAPGGYAELAVTDADRLHRIPPGLDEAEAVAMIGTGRTALGILQFTDLGPDSIALVPAAAGGIGTLLVQYAKNAGAIVIGLAGPAKTAASGPTAPTSPSTTPSPTGPGGSAPTWTASAAAPPSSTTPWAASPAARPSTSSARAGSTSSSAGPAKDSTTGPRSPSPTRNSPNAASHPRASSDRR